MKFILPNAILHIKLESTSCTGVVCIVKHPETRVNCVKVEEPTGNFTWYCCSFQSLAEK